MSQNNPKIINPESLPKREDHISCSLGNKLLLIWGGFTKPPTYYPNPVPPRFLHVYHPDLDLWFEYQTTGNPPFSRPFATGTSFDGKLAVFGGKGHDDDSPLHILDLQTMRWEKMNPCGEWVPHGRHGHQGWYHGGKLWWYGGNETGCWWWTANQLVYYDSRAERQLICYDPNTNTVSYPKYHGTPPSRRAHHIMVNLHNGRVLLHGGADEWGHTYDDIFLLDMKSLTWTKVETQGSIKPTGRYSHAAVKVGKKVLIYGGRGDSETDLTFGDLWSLDTVSWFWEPLDLQFNPRFCHTMANIQDQIYIFGGSQGQSSLGDLLITKSEPGTETRPTSLRGVALRAFAASPLSPEILPREPRSQKFAVNLLRHPKEIMIDSKILDLRSVLDLLNV